MNKICLKPLHIIAAMRLVEWRDTTHRPRLHRPGSARRQWFVIL